MHIINQLYMADYDFPQAGTKNISYMIATIPRSGSTYFALQLWRTGVLGSPLEYLNLEAMAHHFLPRFGIAKENIYKLSREEVVDYWEKVKLLRTSPNGVFGYKMFMIIFHRIIDVYPDIFDDIQPDYIIYLTRRDLIGQAISYSRAKLTKTWFADVPNVPQVSYDYEHIVQCRKEIEMQCKYWEGVFSQANIRPIRVTYEELLENHSETITRILNEMQVSPALNEALPIPMIKRQADKVTDTWRRQFEADDRK